MIGAFQFRKEIESLGKIKASKTWINQSCESEQQADALIWLYVQSLLMAKKYASAGVVLWGTEMFNMEPECTKSVWRAISKNPKVLVMGGGACGKSYTAIAWNVLNWMADPEFTTVKLISTTGGHAKANTFSTIKTLYEKCVVPATGVLKAEALQFKEQDERGCISIVRIREGADNSGVLQGFHPLPREKPHAVFGRSSRVVAVLDEAEEIPNGAWTGVDNMITSADSSGDHSDSVKVMGFFNPKDISGRTAQLCEPPGGWSQFSVETGFQGGDEWKSKAGWHVVRIDPKKTENVKERKKIFAGFQTYEGFRMLEQKDGGNSLSYFTFGRGAYPPEGVVCTVISQAIASSIIGEFAFSGATIKCGSLDTALDGRDDSVFTEGRYGKAIGFNRVSADLNGKLKKDFIRFKSERDVLQIDQQYVLPKGNTERMATSCRDTAKRLGIAPGWLMIDSTGNGASVLGLLRADSFWSPKVGGLDFGKSATGMTVLREDSEKAEDLYDGIDSECWFAFARWAEFGFIGIAPFAASEELQRQLIGRRYKLGAGKLLGVEDKDLYKKRLSRSPDHADSAIILLHRVRTGGIEQAGMTEAREKPRRGSYYEDPTVTKWIE